MRTANTRFVQTEISYVPQLEIGAALLRANLVKAVISALIDQRFHKEKNYPWTDSTVTLACLKEFPRSWKLFVNNDIAKIQKIIAASNRKFMPTEENPADCASQRISATNLKTLSLCWY